MYTSLIAPCDQAMCNDDPKWAADTARLVATGGA